MEYKKYEEGQPLAENEYLLKIRDDKTGFMSKFTQKGELPKAFKEWGGKPHYTPELGRHTTNIPEIMIMEEFPRSGWKIVSWRFGQSQNWATVRHPLGFTVEVYLQDLLHVIKCNTVINGELQGEFSWNAHKLIKRK
jgi:hypothetical protein